jgi:SAM-dependent methyltransferase
MADTTFPWKEIFQGWILDVGCADDILPLPNTIGFDLPDGGGDDLTKFYPPNSFDVVTGSQVLEHMRDPVVALHSWLKVVKPGGYIVASVPSWELYEKRVWPSEYNAGHISTWSLYANASPAEVHCKLPEWLRQFPARVMRCVEVDTNYDRSKPAAIDQTFRFEDGVEAFCEFVLQRL